MKMKFTETYIAFLWCSQVTGISQHHMATASGLSDYDYQNLSNLTLGLKNLNQIETVTKVPIPTEIMEHFKSNAKNCSYYWIVVTSNVPFSRYQMSLYDGFVSRNRPSLVNHRFGYLCEYIFRYNSVQNDNRPLIWIPWNRFGRTSMVVMLPIMMV